MQPYFHDAQLTLWHGHALDVLQRMPDGTVDCIVTSPPYFQLRSYLPDGHPDKHREIGTEPTPREFVAALTAVFAEARRVLANDGTLWLNLGDSYVHRRASGPQGTSRERAGRTFTAASAGGWNGLPDKNLTGIPWRVALALQDDGWILRNDIIWRKDNAMPEPVTDRLSSSHEHVFLLTKAPVYWFDLDTIRQDRIKPAPEPDASGRNPGDVWSIPTVPFPQTHFAAMPPELAERCLLAGCRPGGTVLDPFSGSGTTGMVAAKHGHRFVGIDLNEDYLRLSLQTRLTQPALLWDLPA